MATDGDELGESILKCGLSSARVLAEALNCIFSSAHRGEEVMMSSVGEGAGGLRFTVEEFGCLQACALLERESFTHFTCTSERLCIRVNLSELIDCLSIFGGVWDKSLTALSMEYPASGGSLLVTIQEKDAIIQSSLSAIEGTVLNDFRFLSSGVLNSAILSSDVLRDALLELDYAGATVGVIRVSSSMPKLKFESSSVTGAACEVEFPDPDENIQIFTSFRSIKLQSDSVRMRVNRDGMLSLVMKLKIPGSVVKNSCFIEFLLVAEEIVGDEEEDGKDIER